MARAFQDFLSSGGVTGDGCQEFYGGWFQQGGKDLFNAGWNTDNGCELFNIGWLYNGVAQPIPIPPDDIVHPMGSPRVGDRRILRDDDEIVFATLVAFMEIRDRWH